MNAEKPPSEPQQEPTQEAKSLIRKRQPTSTKTDDAIDAQVVAWEASDDIERGTVEKWNEGLKPPKPIRRKFSRTVPYETAIDGGPGGDYDDDNDDDDNLNRAIVSDSESVGGVLFCVGAWSVDSERVNNEINQMVFCIMMTHKETQKYV